MDLPFIINPLLPMWLMLILALLGAVSVLAAWRLGLSGWALRTATLTSILIALFNPSLLDEVTEPLPDIVVAAVDRSSSQELGDRAAATDLVLEALRTRIDRWPDTELRVVEIGDGPDNSGTLFAPNLRETLADVPQNQIAATFLVSDGRVRDAADMPKTDAPVHTLLTGSSDDWDRRIVIDNAPAFGIVGEAGELSLRMEDLGNVPESISKTARLGVSVNGNDADVYEFEVGKPVVFSVSPATPGPNLIHIWTDEQEGELTDRNNQAVVEFTGINDRLRVLLVSGEPHAGERTWRNLLKSDLSVDLVHFTILRPPGKRGNVPVNELSLIAFPTRELFLEKIDEFDLIIFDRYQLRGILPASYLKNVVDYVKNGGAVLVSAGPEFATAGSLYHSPLGEILPAAPTGIVLEEAYRPKLTDTGRRHPLTATLQDWAGSTSGQPDWGRWIRYIEVRKKFGDVLMNGPDDLPLLVTNRAQRGRISILASDHAWLWSRGYEGGGPQSELLRRLAHWMMKQPELEEEALFASADGLDMTITRRSLKDEVGEVEITRPDGTRVLLPMAQQDEGLFQTKYQANEHGLYRLRNDDRNAVVVLGPASPVEYENTIASSSPLDDIAEASGGALMRIEGGIPDIRRISTGSVFEGKGWLGIKARDAYRVLDTRYTPLLPPWAYLLLISGLLLWGWLREGRR